MTTPSSTSKHLITIQYWDRMDSTIATCLCGWEDRWPGHDGSAEQSGEAHVAREARRHPEGDDQ